MAQQSVTEEAEVIVHGRHVELSDRFREHVADKLDRIGKYGVLITRVDVEVSKENNPRLADRAYVVELTCRSRGPVIRAEAFATDQYSAFDIAFTRLTERLRRYAERNRPHRGGRHTHKGALSNQTTQLPTEAPVIDDTAEGEYEVNGGFVDEDTTVLEIGPVVVREKTHTSAPMSVEDAVTQMELVGHDFFLFQDVDTGLHSVVYRRRGYDYGLIRVDTNSQ